MENIMSMSLEDRAKIAKNLLDVLLCAMQGDDKIGDSAIHDALYVASELIAK